MRLHRTPPLEARWAQECERGLNDVAGFLLWRAKTEAARRDAETFADPLTWLTTAQREDVVRVYTADRLALGCTVLQCVVDRAAQLWGAYQMRHQVL